MVRNDLVRIGIHPRERNEADIGRNNVVNLLDIAQFIAIFVGLGFQSTKMMVSRSIMGDEFRFTSVKPNSKWKTA